MTHQISYDRNTFGNPENFSKYMSNKALLIPVTEMGILEFS